MFNTKVETNYKLLLPAEIVIKALKSQMISASEIENLEISTKEDLLAAIKKDKNWTIKTRVDLAHFFGNMVLADEFSQPKAEPVNSENDFEAMKKELKEDLSQKRDFLEAVIEKL